MQSRTTLLGLVKHLVLVEQWWFPTTIGGEPAPAEDPDDPDAEWLITPDEDPERIVADYRAACARSNEIARVATSLDTVVTTPDGYAKSVRWILVHMVEETARHAGHADILRELIDGRIGS